MSKETPRGLLGFFVDLLNWLRIYKERDFWIQIAIVFVGIILWMVILPPEGMGGVVRALPSLFILCFIMTNITWAISRKPYSSIIGSLIGYGLYNIAVGIIVYRLSISDILVFTLLGTIYGLVFSWFAFTIFRLVGLVKFRKQN